MLYIRSENKHGYPAVTAPYYTTDIHHRPFGSVGFHSVVEIRNSPKIITQRRTRFTSDTIIVTRRGYRPVNAGHYSAIGQKITITIVCNARTARLGARRNTNR